MCIISCTLLYLFIYVFIYLSMQQGDIIINFHQTSKNTELEVSLYT